jgi:hypothetical protein
MHTRALGDVTVDARLFQRRNCVQNDVRALHQPPRQMR